MNTNSRTELYNSSLKNIEKNLNSFLQSKKNESIKRRKNQADNLKSKRNIN